MKRLAHPLRIPSISRDLVLYTHGPSDRFVSREIERDGVWEPYETEIILGHLGRGATFVDVGANIGYYTVIASSVVGEAGRVVAFEPDPANFALLERNLEANGVTNAVAIPQALGAAPGEAYLYLCDDNRGDHRLYDSHDERARIPVAVVDLDSFVERQGMRVDFVKVDAQGSETNILRGMQRLLRRPSQRLSLILELWPFGLRKNGSSPAEMLSLVPAGQFDISVIDEETRTRRPIMVEETLAECEGIRYTEWQGFLNLLLVPRV